MIRRSSNSIRIGVIGAGWLGSTVGRLLGISGHQVMFSSRHPENHAGLTHVIGANAYIGSLKDAASFGDVLLFAVPFNVLPELGRDLAELIRGKIVLDACNTNSDPGDPYTKEGLKNGVAETSVKYLPMTRLVRAFSAVDAQAIDASAAGRGIKLGVPLASDYQDEMMLAAELVKDVGCEPVITGKLASAVLFQREGPGYRANTSAPKLRKLMGLEIGTVED